MRTWICPTCKKHCKAPGTIGSKDVRRFCLPCSQATGKLVERSCPSLERDRKKRQTPEHFVDFAGVRVDLASFTRKCWAVPAVQQLARTNQASKPVVRFKKSKKPFRVDGTAFDDGRVRLAYHKQALPFEVLTTILHELIHVAQNLGDAVDEDEHNLLFRHTLTKAADQVFGVCVAPDEEHIYGTDARIALALYAKAEQGHLQLFDVWHRVNIQKEASTWNESLRILYAEELKGFWNRTSEMSSSWMTTP